MTSTRPAPSEAYVTELRELGAAQGLDAVGVARAEPFASTMQVLEERKAAGLHADMAFTYRNPARSADPTRALPDAASLIVGARSYHREVPAPPDHAGPLARVAQYVWEDHYGALEAALSVLAQRLKRDGWRARVLSDDNALVDREAAYRAGLGWYGKNANLLLPGQGSWFVLGAVLTDAPLPVTDARVADACGTCTRCLDACPTNAIVAPGVVDARRCLSWLLQKPGIFPIEHRVALGDRIYGCDDCQDVCPPNRTRDRRTDPAIAHGAAWVPVLDLLEASDADVLAQHDRWYIYDRDADYLRRNALLVLANHGADDAAVGWTPRVDAILRTLLVHRRAMLRAHAVWAAARLGRADLLALVAGDESPEVRAELADLRSVEAVSHPDGAPVQHRHLDVGGAS
jgi:epoxyqueuosine reductase